MKRMSALLLCGLTILLSVFLFLMGDSAFKNPMESTLSLEYPQAAVHMSSGGISVIDSSSRRIVRLDADNNVLFTINGGARNTDQLYIAADILEAPDDGLFVLNYLRDDKGMFLLREDILWYDRYGQLIATVYSQEYDKKDNTLVQRGRIRSLSVDNEYLYWYEINNSALESVRMSYDRNIRDSLYTLAYPKAAQHIADIARIDSQRFVATHKNGSIISYNHSTEEITSSLPVSNNEQANARIIVPWEIEYRDSKIVLLDITGRRFLRYAFNNGKIVGTSKEVLSPSLVKAKGYPDDPFMYYRLNLSQDGTFVTCQDYNVISFSVDGDIKAYVSEGVISSSYAFVSILFYVLFAALVVCLYVIVRYIYVSVLQRRLSLVTKQLLLLIPLLVASMLVITTLISNRFLSQHTEEQTEKAAALTQTIAATIDGDLFNSVNELSDYDNQAYRDIRAGLHKALNYNQDSWNEGYYFALYRIFDSTLYGFMYLNDGIGMYHPFSWYSDAGSVYKTSAEEGIVTVEKVSDVSGDWLYGVAPVYDSKGELVALLEVGTDLYSFRETNHQLFLDTMRLMGVVTLLIVIVVIVMTFIILKSLSVLKRGVRKIADGDWDHQITIQSRDEVSELGQSFNEMSQYLSEYVKTIEDLNITYKRFFPEQFLKYLDLPSMVDARLGDQVQKEMTILFSDIRAFTSISEQMSPEENFNFLNEYLNLVGPEVRNHGGFIDKYIGDAIMALFPSTPEDAIRASIQIAYALMSYNKVRIQSEKDPIDIGVGIHTGTLMLGILGEEERMQGTVIADSVNLASRLESLTKHYGAMIIVSEDAMNRVVNKERFMRRYLGKTKVIGKAKAMGIYEILDCLPEDTRVAKASYKTEWEQAVQDFETGNVEVALNVFTDLGKRFPSDKVIALFRKAAESYVARFGNKKMRGWEGAIVLKSK